ncbi:hypothetical protein [Actinoplanes sp. NPDC026619]|uniref:hypothetical protein n=1 Tax=Actinoplanes sp. NPDC026619 TaxID=3155798 RepID=UPI0033C1E0EB
MEREQTNHGARLTRQRVRHWIPVFVAISLVFALFLAYLLVLLYVPVTTGVSSADLATTSLLGEGFGGLNTLFSGLAFAILIGTVIYQRKDMLASERRLESALEHQASMAATARRELEENTLQMRANMFAIGEQTFVTLERSIAQVPSVLRFHGLGEEDLERAGITAAELSYLMATLTAGGIPIKATAISNPESVNSEPFPAGSYYHTLLSSADVQRAWGVIGHIFADSIYKKKIEATLHEMREARPEGSGE